MKHSIVYTRAGCHLCDEAIELLRKKGLSVKTRDIDEDEELRQRFDKCVPVVEVDGKIRFRGKVNPILLDRLLSDGDLPN